MIAMNGVLRQEAEEKAWWPRAHDPGPHDLYRAVSRSFVGLRVRRDRLPLHATFRFTPYAVRQGSTPGRALRGGAQPDVALPYPRRAAFQARAEDGVHQQSLLSYRR